MNFSQNSTKFRRKFTLSVNFPPFKPKNSHSIRHCEPCERKAWQSTTQCVFCVNFAEKFTKFAATFFFHAVFYRHAFVQAFYKSLFFWHCCQAPHLYVLDHFFLPFYLPPFFKFFWFWMNFWVKIAVILKFWEKFMNLFEFCVHFVNSWLNFRVNFMNFRLANKQKRAKRVKKIENFKEFKRVKKIIAKK